MDVIVDIVFLRTIYVMHCISSFHGFCPGGCKVPSGWHSNQLVRLGVPPPLWAILFQHRPCCLPCWCALLPVVWTLPQPLDLWLQPPLCYLTAVRGRLPSCCSSCPLPVTCCGCECQTPTSSSLNWNFRG